MRAVDRELNRLGKGGREEVRRRDRGERDEVNAVRVAVDPAGGGLEGEPGLTRPARPHKREQAAGGVLQQPVDRFQLRRPAETIGILKAGSGLPPLCGGPLRR